MPQNSNSRYFPELDVLRAVAAVLVMAFHLGQCGLIPLIPGFVNLAHTGIDLFFVLSGFLITSTLLGMSAGDWQQWRMFMGRRALRIFPLYYSFLIVSVLVGGIPGWQYWVFLQNIADGMNLPVEGPRHFWSLALQEHFYFVWPLVVLFASRRFLVPIIGSMFVISAALRFLLTPHVDIGYLTFTRMDGLAAGALVAVALQKRLLQDRAGLLKLGLCGFGVITFAAGLAFSSHGYRLMDTFKFTLDAGFYALLVAVLVSREAVPGWVARLRGLRFTGKVSYGLYIFHPMIFAFWTDNFTNYPAWERAAAAMITSFALAIVSWYGFERHFIGLKDRLKAKPVPLRAQELVAG